MRTSDSITKIAEALAKMQPELGVIGKSGENKFDKYTYATLEDYIKGTRDVLSRHGFFLITSAEKLEQLPDRITKNGGAEHAIQINLTLRLIHQSGEWIEVSCIGEGQDRADKAVYKAITGARKYAIASLLGLATSDDPEADEAVGLTQAVKKKEPLMTDKTVTDYIKQMRNSKSLEELKDNFEAAMSFVRSIAADPATVQQITSTKDTIKTGLMRTMQ